MSDKKPKATLTAYFQFQSECKEEFAHIQAAERSKAISDKWKGISEEEKKKYSENYKVAYAQFSKDLKEFYEKFPEEKKKDEAEAEAKK